MLQPLHSDRPKPTPQRHQYRLPIPAGARAARSLDVTSKPRATQPQIEAWVNAQSILAQDQTDRKDVGRLILRIQNRTTLKRFVDIYLNDCLGMSTLPPIIYAPRNLWMRANSSLTEFARIAYIEGDMDLSNCRALRSLGEQLHVGGNLKLDGCQALTQLPGYLRVGGDLNLSDTAITYLPHNMFVRGSLFLKNCTSLRRLPPGLSIHGELHLDGCSALEALPGDLWLAGSLNIKNCSALQTISNEVHFSENLFADNCLSLRYIPARIPYKNVHLRGCESIRHLSNNLRVSDELFLNNCESLQSIPKTSARTRHINTEHTTYAKEIAFKNRLQIQERNTQTSNMLSLWELGQQNTSALTRFKDAPPRSNQFTNAQDAIEFWKHSLQIDSRPISSRVHHLVEQLVYALWHLTPQQETLLVDFLFALTQKVTFQDEASRPFLTIRVLFVLGAMQNDFAIRQALFRDLKKLRTFDPNEILADLEISVQLALLRRNHANHKLLSDFGLTYFNFAMSEKILHRHFENEQKKQHADFDEKAFNRTLLSYQTHNIRASRKKFSVLSLLPPYNNIDNTNETKVSNHISRILVEQLSQSTPTTLKYIWNDWRPMQYTDRYEKLRNFLLQFEQQPVTPVPQDLQNKQCSFTRQPFEKLRTPVYTQQENSNKKIYEAAKLLEYWLEHGTDPAGKRLDLADIHRLPQKDNIFSHASLLSVTRLYDHLDLKNVPSMWLKKEQLDAWVDNAPKKSNLEQRDRKLLADQLYQFLDTKHQTLVLPNTLAIENLAHLTSLPDGLHVDGDLYLNGLSSLKDLPAILSATGNIQINACSKLTRIPSTLKINGSLGLKKCFRLEILPSTFQIPGNLTISRCHSLKRLPEKLSVGGDLHLEDCSNLLAIQKEALVVPGKLKILRCRALKSLASKTTVGSGLLIEECTALARISEELAVTGDCRIFNCKGLIEFPKQVSVTKSLDLTGASALPALAGPDATLKIGMNLLLTNCSGLTTLPEALDIAGDLDLSGCTGLKQLPQQMNVGKTIRCHDCFSLSHIPNGFEARNNLTLRNCVNLTTLPQQFTIGGRLSIKRSAVLPATRSMPLILNSNQTVGELSTDIQSNP